jgi:hypothetical protein
MMHILFLHLSMNEVDNIRTGGYGWWRKRESMARKKIHSSKEEKRYIVCPWCGQKVQYSRRAGHGCFKFHLSEIERNAQQMNRG